MDERRDETQDQFDQPQSQEPAKGGHGEEQPGGGGSSDTESEPDQKERGEKPGSPPGAAGEGTQSTGNPLNAG
jgi:hypothetical protein